jgi:hypothetical protein
MMRFADEFPIATKRGNKPLFKPVLCRQSLIHAMATYKVIMSVAPAI